MTLASQIVASGPGWFVQDIVCSAGPADPVAEECHRSVCLAAVIGGTFHYRTSQGGDLLVPGAVLLGNAGCGFECSHEHGTGDRCLSVHFTEEYWERLVADLPPCGSAVFRVPRLPPRATTVAVTALLQTAREQTGESVEEAALGFAADVMRRLSDPGPSDAGVGRPRDLARVAEVVRHIEACVGTSSHEALGLGALARLAEQSPYHFLRTFRSVAGMTPHQFVLRVRLNRAAVRLRQTGATVSEIAFDAGFNDLSTFNRRFRRLIGMSPASFRRLRA